MNISHLIRYYRDCYEADNRRSVIWNFLERTTEHRYFLEGEEDILTASLNPTVMDEKIGVTYFQQLQRYPKEKELVYASLFVMGWFPIQEGKIQKICTPLLTHRSQVILKTNDGKQRVVAGQSIETNVLDAHFSQYLHQFNTNHPKADLASDLFAFLSVDRSECQINQTLFKTITGQEFLGEQVWQLLNSGELQLSHIQSLSELIKEALPQWNTDALLSYPHLMTESEMRAIWHKLDEKPDQWFVVPVSMTAIIPKSVETRGVLSELASLASQTHFSAPLRTLFGQGNTIQTNTQEVLVPAVLSDAQQKIIHIGRESALSLAIGPPGTGKSFTIASLAIEHLSRNETVLIASKMNQAVDVVSDKIEQQIQMEHLVVRGGRKQYLSELKKHLESLLQGIKRQPKQDMPLIKMAQEYLNEAHLLQKRRFKVEKKLRKKQLKVQKWAMYLQASGKWFQKKYVAWQTKKKRFLWQDIAEVETLHQQIIQHVRKVIQASYTERLHKLLHEKRVALTTFLSALRARESGKQLALFESLDMNTILHAFPIWLVNLSDIYKVLPFEREMFDLAIIDEATQCDIATCLPIFQRAKRVIIVGDPHQLRHVSFLADQQQQQFQDKYALSNTDSSLDYRQNSILDVVQHRIESQEQVVFLNEHYRSVPSIIRFSNSTFYQNALHIMTEKTNLNPAFGAFLHPIEGTRNQKGINEIEAAQIITDIQNIIKIETETPPKSYTSIGILSPFRDQIDYISDMIAKVIPMETYMRHQIMTGTAHTFQGEERDTMFLSLCLDNTAHSTAFRYLSKPEVLNVSITRARNIQHIYCSFSLSKVSAETLIGDFLHQINEKHEDTFIQDEASPFTIEIQTALQARGCKVYLSYPLAGSIIDLVVEKNGRICGIDVLDQMIHTSTSLDLERYRMFQRVHLHLIPITFPEWYFHREACLQHIETILSKNYTYYDNSQE